MWRKRPIWWLTWYMFLSDDDDSPSTQVIQDALPNSGSGPFDTVVPSRNKIPSRNKAPTPNAANTGSHTTPPSQRAPPIPGHTTPGTTRRHGAGTSFNNNNNNTDLSHTWSLGPLQNAHTWYHKHPSQHPLSPPGRITTTTPIIPSHVEASRFHAGARGPQYPLDPEEQLYDDVFCSYDDQKLYDDVAGIHNEEPPDNTISYNNKQLTNNPAAYFSSSPRGAKYR